MSDLISLSENNTRCRSVCVSIHESQSQKQKSPSRWMGFLRILVAWGGIEPPLRAASIKHTRRWSVDLLHFLLQSWAATPGAPACVDPKSKAQHQCSDLTLACGRFLPSPVAVGTCDKPAVVIMKTWLCQGLLRQTSQFTCAVAPIQLLLPRRGENGLLRKALNWSRSWTGLDKVN